MKRNLFSRIIAILLFASLLFTGFVTPTSSSTISKPDGMPLNSATANESNITSDSQQFISDSKGYVDVEVIGEIAEITALRDEYTKHFRLANGTYEAVTYKDPIHRKDKDGVWQDINNSLALEKGEGDLYKYTTPDLRIQFTNSFKANNELFTLSENGYTISMMLLSDNLSSKVSATAELNADVESKPIVSNTVDYVGKKSFNSIEDAAKIDNRSSIVYNDVKTNTTLEYILQSNDVKENIIISAPCENYEYKFQMNLVGLRAELDDGNIKIYDFQDGQVKYIIPSPYMYDNNNEYSTAVYYELNSTKDGMYLLTVSADKGWINSPKRAFPVVIDPSITTNNTVMDSYVYSTYPNDNYGDDEDLWVGQYGTAYFRMNIPNLPSGATFNSARLHVSYYYYVTTGSMLTGAYQILGNWNDTTLTYNNAPAINTTRLSTAILTASTVCSESSPGQAYYNITNAVSDWYNGNSSNFGIAIKRESSSTHTNNTVILKSYEAGEDYAYMTVNYTHYIPDGVYALQNGQSTTRWMTVGDDSMWSGDPIQQVYSASNPADTSVFDRSSLFKISRVGNTYQYIIRSMLNNNLSFGISGTKILTKEIPSADAEVANSDTFFIEWDGYGFLIRPYGSSNVIKMYSTSTANLTITPKAGATSSARWNLKQYTGVHQRGGTVFYPTTLNAGTTVTFTPKVWSTYIDYNTPHLSVTSGYEDKATTTWNESTQQGTFVLHDNGTLKVTTRIYNGAQTSSYSLSHTFNLTLVVDEGVYFFKNKEVGKYMQIDDNDEPDYSTGGAMMELWDLDGEDYQKWQITHIIDGYYKIISVKSALALCVDSIMLNVDEEALIQEYYSDLDRKKWKITESSSGAYIIRPKSGEAYSTDWCMCAGDQFLGITDGLNVEQKTYVNNNNYKDEWMLQSINCNLSTPIIGQETAMWCWVTSAEMLARTKYPTAANNGDYSVIEQEQRSAVYHVFGDDASTFSTYDWNADPQNLKSQAGIYTDVADAAAFLVGEVGGNEIFSAYPTPYTEGELLKFLLDGYAVARLYGWVNMTWSPPTTKDELISELGNLNPNIGGHVTVIVGAEWSYTEQCYIYTVNDPWSGGTQIQYNYDQLLYNVILSGDEYEVSFWFPTVVTKTEYSNKTLVENVIGTDYSSN